MIPTDKLERTPQRRRRVGLENSRLPPSEEELLLNTLFCIQQSDITHATTSDESSGTLFGFLLLDNIIAALPKDTEHEMLSYLAVSPRFRYCVARTDSRRWLNGCGFFCKASKTSSGDVKVAVGRLFPSVDEVYDAKLNAMVATPMCRLFCTKSGSSSAAMDNQRLRVKAGRAVAAAAIRHRAALSDDETTVTLLPNSHIFICGKGSCNAKSKRCSCFDHLSKADLISQYPTVERRSGTKQYGCHAVVSIGLTAAEEQQEPPNAVHHEGVVATEFDGAQWSALTTFGTVNSEVFSHNFRCSSCPYLVTVDMGNLTLTAFPHSFLSHSSCLRSVTLPKVSLRGGDKRMIVDDMFVGEAFLQECVSLEDISNFGTFLVVDTADDVSHENFTHDPKMDTGYRGLGANFLHGCKSLQTLHVPVALASFPTWGATVYFRLSNLRHLTFDAVPEHRAPRQIPTGFLSGAASLTHVDLSIFSYAQAVHPFALEGCESLETIDLRPLRRVKHIDQCFLSGASSLKSIEFGTFDSLEELGDRCLEMAISLETVTMKGCGKLRSVGPGFLAHALKLQSLDVNALSGVEMFPMSANDQQLSLVGAPPDAILENCPLLRQENIRMDKLNQDHPVRRVICQMVP